MVQIQSTSQLDETFRLGKVSYDVVIKEISITLVPEAKVNHYVMAYVGAAISVVDEVEANKTFELLKQLGELLDLDSPKMK